MGGSALTALQRLQATHEPLRESNASWRERHELGLGRLEELHAEATVAAREHYCGQLPA